MIRMPRKSKVLRPGVYEVKETMRKRARDLVKKRQEKVLAPRKSRPLSSAVQKALRAAAAKYLKGYKMKPRGIKKTPPKPGIFPKGYMPIVRKSGLYVKDPSSGYYRKATEREEDRLLHFKVEQIYKKKR